MRITSLALGAGLALLTTLGLSAAWGQTARPEAATERLVVKLRTTGVDASLTARPARGGDDDAAVRQADRARGLAERAGLPLRGSRDLGHGLVALSLRNRIAGDTLASTLARLRADPDVQFAEVDRRRYIRALPSDPLYGSQWYMGNSEPASANLEEAWDTTTGSPDTVIAVLDTGVRLDHPDLAGRLVPGYDFVSGESSSSFVSANDGDDWDNDPADPGDWVSVAESSGGILEGCPVGRSSWHGTRVAGMVGATTDNGEGIAGGLWQGGVLPVRVLGKCGGYDSDIVAGMRWAAGLPVAGVPANPNPAQILNLSLGSPDTCSAVYQDAISELNEAGVLVVVSAGNDSGPVDTPANCEGVLAVGGLRHVGTKVGYSSLGPEVGVSAPAGNCPELDVTFLCSYSLVTADNTGQTVPEASSYTDEANYNIGTSFSAPVVAAIAGLMHAVNDGLATDEFIDRIKAGARPFPAPQAGLPTCPTLDSETAQCNCTTSTCGAGMADAPGALAEALRPMARIVAPAGSGAGRNVTLQGNDSGAARGRTLNSYAWTVVSGNAEFVGATNEPDVVVAVPESGRVTVRLAVTDDAGRSDLQDVTLGSTSSGGGGGGAIHPFLLLALGLLALRQRPQR